jgi:amino acid transporter
VVTGILVAGIIVAVRAGASAVPWSGHEAFSFSFGKYGWVFGIVLLYLVGVETPYNMGAEFEKPRSATKMVLWGSVALAIGYIFGTVGVLLSTPADELDPVAGVPKVFKYLDAGGIGPIVAIGLTVVMLMAFTIYQSAYSRLVFVSGLERHLPRLFTHLNPRTRNPITALLIQGVISSVLVVVLYSQQSLTTIFLSIQGALTVLWLASGPIQVRRPLRDRDVLAHPGRQAWRHRHHHGRPRRHRGGHLLHLHAPVQCRHQEEHLDVECRLDLGNHTRGCRHRLHTRSSIGGQAE